MQVGVADGQGRVATVNGVMGVASLGRILCHEHIVAASPGIVRSWPSLFGGRRSLIDRAVRVLEDVRTRGIDTIIDCTTFDLGRDAELLGEVSELSGVNVIAATGVWLDPAVTLRVRSVKDLSEWFIRDLTEGMDGSDIRAGVIKLASNESVEPFARDVLAAAAIASQETGAPIITHTDARFRTGIAQAVLLEEHGVSPARVAIGHCDDSDDFDYLLGLASRGYRIAMDRLPNGALANYGPQTVANRLDMIVRLVNAGYGDRIMLGHDDPIWACLLDDDDQRRHRKSNPRSLCFVSDVVVGGLLERGLSADAVDRLMTGNPQEWLCGGGYELPMDEVMMK